METGLFCGSLPASLGLLFPSNVSFDIILSNIKTPYVFRLLLNDILVTRVQGTLNWKQKIYLVTFCIFDFLEQCVFKKILLFFLLHFLNVCFRTTVWEPPGWTDFASCRTDVSLLQSSFVKDFSSTSNLIVANYGDWIGKE